ncbi:hypothetical protein T492DRAFT_951123 [Pavlovales sp. CCMP2436]|nr:hypothetical protein T492DRAFT_951123 [Pavlovales sp. CCMP2436]|mmetsp:Transcript_45064/g.111697  ORF Transcript_45064/g.111697 Transcript_45064/m.111697 type:complete len:239 (-) Transcript_45064:100-816(-)
MRAHRNVQIGDVSLSREDIALLVPPCWINDQLITAAFELLRRRLPGDDRLYAVGASEAMMMAHLDDPSQLRLLFEPLKLRTRHLVLLPVSDHDEPDLAGGTHWSLLAFYRSDGVESFFHFDSLSHMNAASAEHLARRVAPLLGTRQTHVVACPTPKQTNGYDCGMYTIQIAEICAAHMGEDVVAIGEIINSEVTPQAIRNRRIAFIRTLQEMLGETAPEAVSPAACAVGGHESAPGSI